MDSSAISSPVTTLELFLTADLEPGDEAVPRASLVMPAAGPAVLGRDADCDLVIPTRRASRRHCEVELLPGGAAIVRDLGSANGVRLGERVVRGEARIAPGSWFTIGEFSILLSPPEPPAPPAGGAARQLSRQQIVAAELLLALVLVLAGWIAGLRIGHRIADELGSEATLADIGNQLGDDSSFEAPGTGLPGWSVSSRGGVFRADRTRGGIAGGGKLCLEVAPGSQTLPGDRCIVASSVLVPVRPGEVLLGEVAIFTGQGAAGGCLAIELLASRSSSLGTMHSVPVTESGTWRTARLSLTVPERVGLARLLLLTFGGGTAVASVRYDQVVLVKRPAEVNQHPAWASLGGASLRVTSRVDGTFAVAAGGEVVVQRAAMVIGENPLFHPTASQLFAGRPLAPLAAGDGVTLQLDYRPGDETPTFRVTHRLQQESGSRFTATAELPPGCIDAFWVLDLAPEVSVLVGDERVEPTVSAGRGSASQLLLALGDHRLLVQPSRPVAFRLDPSSAGTTLSLAFPREGARGRRAALQIELDE